MLLKVGPRRVHVRYLGVKTKRSMLLEPSSERR